ncbi:MAG: LEA type 2 family protein [Pseudomonadales bacterium]
MIRYPARSGIRRATAPRVFGVLLALLLAGCAAPAVDVALVGIAPMESTLLEQRLRLDFRLQNFGERAIRATGMELTLDVNGRQLARGVDSGSFQLERLGETRVSAVVSTSLLEITRQLLSLLERDKFDYQLRGRIYLDGWPRSVPFTRSGEISREQLERLAGIGGRSPGPLRLE